MDVLVPRLNTKFSSESVRLAILQSVQKLGYDRPTQEQADAVKNFVLGKDVLVNLPTGSGKSLCYAMLPLVFDILRREKDHTETHHSIVVVVSPLVSIMKDQTEAYSKRGLRCASVGKHQTDTAIRDGVRNGEYQVVYMSPESMLTVLSWREMFRSELYLENIVGLAVDEAHCMEKWLANVWL